MGIVIRQSIKGTIVTYVGAFIGSLTTLFIVTQFLTQELIGLYRVLFEAASLLAGLALLGSNSSAPRFFPYFKDKTKDNNGFFFYLVAVPTIGFLIIIPLFLILKVFITNYFIQKSPLFVNYFYWIIPFAFFILYWMVFENYSMVLMRIAVPKFIREILVRVLLIVVYALYAFGLVNVDGFVACYIAVYGVAMFAAFYYASRIGPVSLKHDPAFADKPLRSHFLTYTSILFIGALGGSVISRIDIFMISSEIGLDHAGIYTLAFFIAATIEIPSRSISSISSPLAAEAFKEGEIRKANNLFQKVSLHQLLIGSFIFLIIWINIDNIYAIIPNGKDYIEGKWVVLFLGIAKLIEVTLSFGGNMISYSKHYRWSMYFVFFISAFTILANNQLIPMFGITGAAIATALTCFVSYGLQQWVIFTKIKGNPFSMGTLKQIMIILLLLGLNIFLPKINSPWIDGIYRTIIIGATGVFLIYVFRVSEEVNSLLKKLTHRFQ